MRPKVIISSPVDEAALKLLAPHAEIVVNEAPEPWPRAELIRQAADAFGWIAFMSDALDEDLLRTSPALRIVAGALKGYDNFDVDACTRHGVWLTVVPDLLTAPTADLTLGLLLALSRKLLEGDRLVRSGAFHGWRPVLYGRGLDDATVGFLGMGALGQAVARRLAGFGSRLVYFDEQPLPEEAARSLNLARVGLAQIAAESDVVILALPLTPRTAGIVDRSFLADLKPGCLLINPARGSLVDEAAVAAAIDDGWLGGYAADVFAIEDIGTSKPAARRRIPTRLLADARHTVLTPHLGSAVRDVRRRIVVEAAANIVDCIAGRRPRGAVNSIAAKAEGRL